MMNAEIYTNSSNKQKPSDKKSTKNSIKIKAKQKTNISKFKIQHLDHRSRQLWGLKIPIGQLESTNKTYQYRKLKLKGQKQIE